VEMFTRSTRRSIERGLCLWKAVLERPFLEAVPSVAAIEDGNTLAAPAVHDWEGIAGRVVL
jgi:hypothetical protein